MARKMTTASNGTRGPGRPRSAESRDAILAAAMRLAKQGGYGALTVDGIAAEAGVGKQTIYRWWSSRGAVMLEALQDIARTEIETKDTGDLEGDLRAFLESTFAAVRRPGVAAVLRGVAGEAQQDDDFAELFRRELIDRRRGAMREVFARGVARGEVPRSVDTDFAMDVLFGAFWYRLLFRSAPLDARYAHALAPLGVAAVRTTQKR